jgi:hypothetical protein
MELSEAVEAVRSALMLGAARGAGQGVRFEVGEIRMDFTVELQRTSAGRGGVKAWGSRPAANAPAPPPAPTPSR